MCPRLLSRQCSMPALHSHLPRTTDLCHARYSRHLHKTLAPKGAALWAQGLVRCWCLCENERKRCLFLLAYGVWAGLELVPIYSAACPCAGLRLHKSYHNAERVRYWIWNPVHQRGSFQSQLRRQKDICQLRRLITHCLFLNRDCQASPKLRKDNCRPSNNKDWIIDS